MMKVQVTRDCYVTEIRVNGFTYSEPRRNPRQYYDENNVRYHVALPDHVRTHFGRLFPGADLDRAIFRALTNAGMIGRRDVAQYPATDTWFRMLVNSLETDIELGLILKLFLFRSVETFELTAKIG